MHSYVEICLSTFAGSAKKRESLEELRLDGNLPDKIDLKEAAWFSEEG